MESTHKAFLKKLAKGFAKEIDYDISEKKLRKCYEKIIKTLPPGISSDVKQGLVKNHHLSSEYFIRCAKRTLRKHGKTSQPAPDGDEGHQNESTAVTSIDNQDNQERRLFSSLPSQLPKGPSVSQNAQAQFIVQQLHRMSDVDQLSGLVSDFEASCSGVCPGVEKFSKLLALTTGSTDITVLKKIMQLHFNAMREETEEILAVRSQEQAKQLEQTLCGFLEECHLRRSVCDRTDDKTPLYSDLLACLLSVYLDLFLVRHGNEAVEKKERKRLCSVVSHLMAGYGVRIFDVVLQVTAASQENATCLKPLLKRILREKPDRKNNEHYLRYMLVVRMWSQLLQLQDAVMEAHLVRAPKGFMTWLLERNPALSGELPTDRKFKGRIVTSFLLDDADDNAHSMLLDALADQTGDEETAEVSLPDTHDEEERDKIGTGDEMIVQSAEDATDGTTSVPEGGLNKEKRAIKKSRRVENGTESQGSNLFVVDRVGDSKSLNGSRDPGKKLKKKRKLQEPEQPLSEETERKVSESSEGADMTQTDNLNDTRDLFTIDRKGGKTDELYGEGEESAVKKKKRTNSGRVADSSSDPGKRRILQEPEQRLSEETERRSVSEGSEGADMTQTDNLNDTSDLFTIDRRGRKTDEPYAEGEESAVKKKKRKNNGQVAGSSPEPPHKAKDKMPLREEMPQAPGESSPMFFVDRGGVRNMADSGDTTVEMSVFEKSTFVYPETAETTVKTRSRTLSEKSTDMQEMEKEKAGNVSKQTLSPRKNDKSSKSAVPSKQKSPKSAQSSGTEYLSCEDDVQIFTESNTDTNSPVILPSRQTPSNSGASRKTIPTKTLSSTPRTVPDVPLFSEAASDSECGRISKQVNRLVETLADTNPLRSSVADNSVSEESQDESMVPDLHVHLKKKSPKNGTSSLEETKTTTASPSGKELRRKRKFGSLSQSSHDEGSVFGSPTNVGVPSSPCTSPEFKKIVHRGMKDSNGNSSEDKTDSRASSSVKRSSASDTPASFGFTGLKQKKGKSITPVSRRTRSGKQDASAAGTPRNTSAKTPSPKESETAAPEKVSAASGDLANAAIKKEIKKEKQTPVPTRVKEERDETDWRVSAPKVERRSLSTKKSSSCTPAAVSKKADRRRSAVATRTAVELFGTRDGSRRQSAGASLLKTPKSKQRKSSEDIGEDPAQSSAWRMGADGDESAQTAQTASPQSQKSPQRLKSKPNSKTKSSPSQQKASKQPVNRGGEDSDSVSDERETHEIETRSKSSQKGYNLRRSGKFK